MVYFSSVWNCLSQVSYLSLLVLMVMEIAYPSTHHQERPYNVEATHRVLLGCASVCLFLRVMEILSVWRKTGIFIALVRIMLRDTIRWSVIFSVFLFAFTMGKFVSHCFLCFGIRLIHFIDSY